MRYESSYALQSAINIITNIGKETTTDLKDTWIEPLIDFFIRGKLPKPSSKDHKVKLRASFIC